MRALVLVGLFSVGCASIAGNRPQGPCEQAADGTWSKFQRGVGALSGVGDSTFSQHRAEYYTCKRDAASDPKERAEWQARLDAEKGTYVAARADERAAEAREAAERRASAPVETTCRRDGLGNVHCVSQ